MKRMSELLPESLRQMQVSNDQYLTNVSPASLLPPDQALPQTGKLRRDLEEYIDHFPLVTYCSDQVAIELAERFRYRLGDDQKGLTEYDGFNDADVVSKRLLDGFKALPHRYCVVVELPEGVSTALSLLDRGLKISSDFVLRTSNDDFREEFPRNAKDNARQRRLNPRPGLFSLLATTETEKKEWKDDACYLVIEVNGYIDRYGTTKPAAIARNLAKAFFGLCLALDMFYVEHRFHHRNEAVEFFVQKYESDTLQLDGRFSGSESFNRTLIDMSFVRFKTEYDKDEFKRSYVAQNLGLIQPVFRNRGSNEKLMLAAQWFFDAFARQDETLRFVQTVIVLEVLLGEKADSDEMGIGALLKNRAAYLIAESASDRDDLIHSIGKIYQLRSKIVHSGKQHFSPTERLLSVELRSICQRIFRRELQMLAKQRDDKKTT